MNITGLKKVLPALLRHKIVPYLHGAQGIGKTSVVRQYCLENGLKFIPLYLATQDQGDLVGLLNKNADGTVSHLPPDWMKEAQEGKGIVFLDEVSRAHPDVLQVMFPFLQTGKIHRQGIGPEWRIIAAGNYQNNKFTQTDMSDTALLSRFCHIDVKPEVAEFSSYAEDKGFDCLAAFIRDQPKFLISDAGEGLNLDNIPYDPRAWLEKVSPLVEEGMGEHEYEVIAGCVGRAAAAAYITYKKKNEKPISMSAILRDYDKVRAEVLKHTSLTTGESRFDLLNTAITELYGRLDKTPDLLDNDKLENLKRFLLDLPRELSMSALRGIGSRKFKGKDELVNNAEFSRKLLG